jgi:AraC-like DNA-binding protein
MARGKTLSVVFKANHQHQFMAFPPSLDELVAADHPVRVVHDVLERVDITALMREIRRTSSRRRLLDIACEYGYYDHAHLANDIKRYTGSTPSILSDPTIPSTLSDPSNLFIP